MSPNSIRAHIEETHAVSKVIAAIFAQTHGYEMLCVVLFWMAGMDALTAFIYAYKSRREEP